MRKILFLFVFALVSCGDDPFEKITDQEIEAAKLTMADNPIILERNGIKLIEFTDFPPFKDAKIDLVANNAGFQKGLNKIEFSTSNFSVGESTVEEDKHGIPFKLEGQFLTIYTENGKRNESNGNAFTVDLSEGTNKFLGVLNRSYGVCLKGEEAYFSFNVELGENGSSYQKNLADTALLLTSPRGSYIATENNRVLFDFFMTNIKIESGNYLELSIDQTIFKIEKWAPFWIEGLEAGNHVVSIRLKNAKGATIPTKFLAAQTSTFEIQKVLDFEE